jgi:Rrf2 family protein
MFKISTKSQYGLRAMIYLAENKEKMHSLRDISEKEGISFSYLEKIISKLEKAGLLESRKGSRGGYRLSKSPEKIKIGKIVKAVEDNTLLIKCVGDSTNCLLAGKCSARRFWRELQQTLNKKLDSFSLADLIK